MLERAASHVVPGLRFEQGDLNRWQPPCAPNLIFSNAAFHWVGEHPALFQRLAGALAEGGQLAVQMPANFDYPSHVVARELEEEEPFRSSLGEETRTRIPLAPEEYATLLDDLGFREQLVRLQVYAHHLGGREDVIEWVKGTLLTQYEALLGPDLYAEFLRRYRDELLPRLRHRRPFFYPFKRLLIWARL
jgi:trans-aconitate 2-methyltransferase